MTYNKLVTILLLFAVFGAVIFAFAYLGNNLRSEKDCLTDIATNWTTNKGIKLVSVQANSFNVMDEDRRLDYTILFSKEELDRCRVKP